MFVGRGSKPVRAWDGLGTAWNPVLQMNVPGSCTASSHEIAQLLKLRKILFAAALSWYNNRRSGLPPAAIEGLDGLTRFPDGRLLVGVHVRDRP